MKNKIAALCFFLLGSPSLLLAGGMGAAKVSAPPTSSFRPFVAGDAMYTWPRMKGMDIHAINLADATSVVDTQGWGGRLAVGLMHAMTERFSISGEMGWGYYADTNLDPIYTLSTGAQVIPSGRPLTLTAKQYGFDVLAGLIYTQSRYDLYLKGGALFMNVQTALGIQPAQFYRTNPRADNWIVNGQDSTIALQLNLPGVLPELKVGGAYHFSDHWVANVAWMYAFGGTFAMGAPYLDLGSPVRIGDILTRLHPPSVSTLSFGLEYRFG